jgi:hypothetical protein
MEFIKFSTKFRSLNLIWIIQNNPNGNYDEVLCTWATRANGFGLAQITWASEN